MGEPENEEVADALERVGELLEMQGQNPFRVRSYRRAAHTVRDADRSVAEIYRQQGQEGLQELPGIGSGLSGAIGELVETGELGLLRRLESQVSPVQVLQHVPGIGEELAERLHEELGVDTLADLELAAHDGRLEQVEGIGERRAQGVRDALAGMLSRGARRRSRGGPEEAEKAADPPVELVLELDEEYRRKAERDELRRIAPRRFNPEGEAWLPIMNVERGGWDFTVLFSNTARAHELGKTQDWVVFYYSRDGAEDQCTVVTAGSGPLEGRRVVRGREAECRRYYREHD